VNHICPTNHAVIYKHAGADATQSYATVHPPNLISSTLPASKRIGVMDDSTSDDSWNTQHNIRIRKQKIKTLPDLSTVINSHDFEDVALKNLSQRAWAFYSSAATDLITHRSNRSFLDRILFRPRGLVDVGRISVKTSILGNDVSMPIFISPAALAKLAHPDGELGLARAAVKSGIPICVSTNASYGLEDIVKASKSAATDGKVANVFFQLYVNKDRSNSERLLRLAESIGIKAIFLTIDAPDRGKREADERVVIEDNVHVPMAGVNTGKMSSGGLAKNTGQFIDDTVTWDDIAWIRQHTTLPLLVKGVQSAHDAKRAMDMGLQGILVGNHGGRCLDT
jgi:L-lactate dehydrogenase (cytochrome)